MRTVFCQKYQTELTGLDRPPFPGKQGTEIYNNISKKAWDEWLAHQKRLINEKHLELFDAKTRTFLQEQMSLFFRNAEFEKASGYVEEKKEPSDGTS